MISILDYFLYDLHVGLFLAAALSSKFIFLYDLHFRLLLTPIATLSPFIY